MARRGSSLVAAIAAMAAGCTNDFGAFFESSATGASAGGAANASSTGQGGAAGTTGNTGASGATSSSSSNGSGSGGSGETGCADGKREGYLAEMDIAACSGGFQVPGIINPSTFTPQCDRQGGNDGPLPEGGGCGVEDLCAVGWHLCHTSGEVAANATTGKCLEDSEVPSPVFWLTRQLFTNDKCGRFAEGTSNNVHGCGEGMGETLVGDAGVNEFCEPLTIRLTADTCDAPEADPWECGADIELEAEAVHKPSAATGGVLCCRD